MTPDELIARYRAAYLRANGEEGPTISYERGWFVFSRPWGLKRRAVVEKMTERLEAREPYNSAGEP